MTRYTTLILLFFFIIQFFPFPLIADAQSENHPLYITLHLEGREHQLQNPLILHDGITYAPFRDVFSILGAEVGYTSKHGRVLVWAELEGNRFLLENGTSVFYFNHTLLSLPGVPPLIQGTFYFPLRFLLDLAGYHLHWENQHIKDGEPQKAHIYLKHPNSIQNSREEKTAESQLTSLLPAVFNPSAQKIPVLMYHHLLPHNEHDGNSGSTISVEEFEKQMDYLFSNGYYTITLEDLYLFLTEQKELPPKTVVLTFDDGYKSNFTHAYPAMQQYHFRAVQFPVTSSISGNTTWIPHMTWEMMEISADVFEFHSHSHNLHHYIGDKQALLAVTPEEARDDLLLSRELLDCFAFSYPYGASNEETIELLREIGYRMAFTIRPGYVYPGDDPFQLKRLAIYPETTIEDFTWLLENYAMVPVT